MNYFEKNLKYLQQYNEVLYQQVEERLADTTRASKYSIHSTKNGELSIVYCDGINNKYLLSSYNPSQEANRWGETQPDAEIFIVYGFGLGYHLPYLMQKEIVKKIVVIEPELDIFILALKYVNLEWLWMSDLIELLVGNQEIHKLIKTRYFIDDGIVKKSHLCSLPAYSQIFHKEYVELQKRYSEILGTLLVKINTLKNFGQTWTENFFSNLYDTLINPKIEGLFNKFLKIPIVIIAAGPSLNKNIDLLRELKGKAVLLCVGTAVKALTQHGIKPDLIISVDGSKGNHKIFQDAQIKDIPLVFDSMIYPEIIKEYNGALISANMSNVFMTWIQRQLHFEIGDLIAGPSVANVTFDLARKFGGDPLIFVGQDLAYTDGKTHASHTIYENDRYYATGNNYEVFVEDIFGNQVLTGRHMLTFLRWFESEIKKTPDRIIIDATEGGAKIAGTKIMPLRDVIDQYCQMEFPINKIINDFLQKNTYYSCLIKDTLYLLEQINQEIKNFKKEVDKGLSLLEKLKYMFRQLAYNQKEIQKILKQLDEIDKKILSLESSKLFLHYIFQPVVIPLMNGLDGKSKSGETEEEKRNRILRYSFNLYTILKDVSDIIEEIINKTIYDFTQKSMDDRRVDV